MTVIYFIIVFVYIKGMTPLLLDESVTVIGAALVAAIVTVAALILNGLTMIAIANRIDVAPAAETLRKALNIMGFLAAALALSVLLSYFVLIGFSDRLADEIELFDSYSWHSRDRIALWFCVLISIPVLPLWVTTLTGRYMAGRRPTRDR